MAIPSELPRREVLDLASLVLSGHEYQQLRHEIEHGRGSGPDLLEDPHQRQFP